MKPVKVAIIGCGTIANSAHGPSYGKNPNAQIAYCVDIIPERASALAKKFGDEQTKAITDYHDMLKDPSVDVVSVCVPNYLHAPISIDCLNAGKHVLCEKPASVNYQLVLDMKAAADRNNRILNIGVVNRFNTAVNKVRDLINAGELGDVYHIYCSFRAHRSIPGLGGQFTTKAMAGGGVLIDWGVHFIDLICYCINTPVVKSVSGAAYSKLANKMTDYVYTDMWAGPPKYDGTYDVEEFITGMVRTAGPSITLNGAWAQNIDEGAMFIEFMGDKAGIKLQYGGGFTLYSTQNGMLTQTVYNMKMADMFYDEIDAFIHCAMAGEKIRSNVDQVLVTAQIMDALYQSAETNKEVSFT
ncbi:MAG: Gfo/Idh/MocA family oxidoreductase [Clostridiaceae bacterium]|nr:Gfo/Idh/MocA family oxidoreductase [Clostridiaceae bacterium]